jgi:glycosyltransferase involved in cell wall biosynthesis
MGKKISIIVPVYKTNESYLKKCIESIINQTYKNIEVLLIDDRFTR